MSTLRAEATEAGARLARLAEPLTEMKDRLTDAVGDAQGRLVGARDSAFEAIADKPFRWTVVTFVAGVVVGAILGSRRADY
jgi:hypothetical protein